MVAHQRQSFSHCCPQSWVVSLFQAQQTRDDLLLEQVGILSESDMEMKDINVQENVF